MESYNHYKNGAKSKRLTSRYIKPIKMKIAPKKILFVCSFVWIALNLMALLSSNCTWERGMYYPQYFFPFSGYPSYFYSSERNFWTLLVYTYSYSEFIIYTTIGLGGIYLSKIMR